VTKPVMKVGFPLLPYIYATGVAFVNLWKSCYLSLYIVLQALPFWFKARKFLRNTLVQKLLFRCQIKICFIIGEPKGLQAILLRRLYAYCAFEESAGSSLQYFALFLSS